MEPRPRLAVVITPSTPAKLPVARDPRLRSGRPEVDGADAPPVRSGVDPAVEEATQDEVRAARAAAAPSDSAAAAREIGASCLGFRLRLLDRVVARLYDEELRELGMRRTQLDLLAALQRFGPASPAQLIRVLGLEKSSLSRNLRRLITRELVSESRGSDRRRHMLALTEDGHRHLVAALPAWRRAQERVHELLGDESGEAVRRMARHYWRAQESADARG